MADNFLEKRMDDYARGRTRGPHARRSSGPRPGVAVIKYPPRTVLVLGGDTDAGAAITATLVGAGCTVAFTAADAAAGRATAQRHGGRFYPGGITQALADMAQRGEAPSVAVACDGSEFPDGIERRIRVCDSCSAAVPDEVVLAGHDTAQAAMLCLIVAHAACTVVGQVIRF